MLVAQAPQPAMVQMAVTLQRLALLLMVVEVVVLGALQVLVEHLAVVLVVLVQIAVVQQLKVMQEEHQ